MHIFVFREELEVIFSIENRIVESTYTACSSQSNPLKTEATEEELYCVPACIYFY
jgi:hypothetical protein